MRLPGFLRQCHVDCHRRLSFTLGDARRVQRLPLVIDSGEVGQVAYRALERWTCPGLDLVRDGAAASWP